MAKKKKIRLTISLGVSAHQWAKREALRVSKENGARCSVSDVVAKTMEAEVGQQASEKDVKRLAAQRAQILLLAKDVLRGAEAREEMSRGLDSGEAASRELDTVEALFDALGMLAELTGG